MKNSPKGFALISVLIIILVILAAGGVFYYLHNATPATSTSSSTPTQTNQSWLPASALNSPTGMQVKDGVFYYGDIAFPQIDLATFGFQTALGGHIIFKDKGSAYVDGKGLVGANPATLRILSQGNLTLIADASHVWDIGGRPIKGIADPQTLAIVNEDANSSGEDGNYYFLRDKDNVYNFFDSDDSIDVVSEGDPATFTILGNSNDESGDQSVYEKDANHVYVTGTLMPEADVASFVVANTPGTFDAKDKNHEYLYGKVVQ